MIDKRQQLFTKSTRWVVKIGSSLLTNEGRGLDEVAIADWVRQISLLRKENIEVVLVSSGSVAAGMQRLGWQERPSALHELQAAAAVGQMGLAQAYENCFQAHATHTAQILLTHDDLSNRKRYLNARSTLRSLLALGVVPVVNENDTVVTDEIRFGDNDTLAALVANLVEADLLVILTDQQGLYDKNPSQHADAQLVQEAQADDPGLLGMAGEGGRLGRGGMITKVRAATLAARSGAATLIVAGKEPDVLSRVRKSEQLGSLLWSSQVPDTARKQWLASHLQLAGSLLLDAGAVAALQQGGHSLLSVGVSSLDGQFKRGEVVACLDDSGREVARGLINYSADEVRKIMGQGSDRIESLLGYVDELELIHCDNLVVL